MSMDSAVAPAGVMVSAAHAVVHRTIEDADPQARHGHKSSARGFDGCKGHVGIDPDSELITATAVTPGTTGTPRGGRPAGR